MLSIVTWTLILDLSYNTLHRPSTPEPVTIETTTKWKVDAKLPCVSKWLFVSIPHSFLLHISFMQHTQAKSAAQVLCCYSSRHTRNCSDSLPYISGYDENINLCIHLLCLHVVNSAFHWPHQSLFITNVDTTALEMYQYTTRINRRGIGFWLEESWSLITAHNHKSLWQAELQ